MATKRVELQIIAEFDPDDYAIREAVSQAEGEGDYFYATDNNNDLGYAIEAVAVVMAKAWGFRVIEAKCVGGVKDAPIEGCCHCGKPTTAAKCDGCDQPVCDDCSVPDCGGRHCSTCCDSGGEGGEA